MQIEDILELDFFQKELTKWLSIQDVGRLRCSCKLFDSKLTFENTLVIFDNLMAFRYMIFRNRLDIFESIIFNFHKQQQTFHFPFLISKLFLECASKGKIDLLLKLMTEENLKTQQQHWTKLVLNALNSNQIEMAKFLIENASKLDNYASSRSPSVAENQYFFEVQLSEIIEKTYFRFNNLEFMKWLLSKSTLLKDDIHLEIERMTEELESEKEKEEKSKKQLTLDYLFFASTSQKLSFDFLKSQMNEMSKNNNVVSRLTPNLESFLVKLPDILPENIIRKLSQFKPTDLKQIASFRAVCLGFYLMWYVFISDFESFKEKAKEANGLLGWPLSLGNKSQCVLLLIYQRTVCGKLKSEFLELCFSVLKSQQVELKKLSLRQNMSLAETGFPQISMLSNSEKRSEIMGKRLQMCFEFLIETKQLKMIENLSEISPNELLLEKQKLCSLAIQTNELEIVKCVVNFLGDFQSFERYFNLQISDLGVDSFEILRFFLQKIDIDSQLNHLFIQALGNPDLLKFLVSCEVFWPKLDSKFWKSFITYLSSSDCEDMILFFFRNFQPKFPLEFNSKMIGEIIATKQIENKQISETLISIQIELKNKEILKMH